MPNWCDNRLIVTGPQLERDRFIGHFKNDSDDLTFIDAYVPMPDSQKDNWYSWCLDNWGTKWGDCHTRINTHNEVMTLVLFDTAWAPPQPAIKTISGMFPTLTFTLEYSEPGMCFMGIDVYRNDDVVATWSVEHDTGYPMSDAVDDEGWQQLLEDIESTMANGREIIRFQVETVDAAS